MVDSQEVIDFYRELHAMPETGWHEFRTAAYLADKLRGAGFQVTTGLAGTGVVGVLRGTAPGPVLALRADMDALPFVIDGEPCAIHACGHDAHCAMVLEAALEAARKPVSRGALKILFQPSEELDEGALKMVEAGVIDDVDWLFGMHLRPIQEHPGRAGHPGPAQWLQLPGPGGDPWPGRPCGQAPTWGSTPSTRRCSPPTPSRGSAWIPGSRPAPRSPGSIREATP